ncbi:MAG: hypothetical protein QM805_15205 [Pseudomonas sp.]
MFKKGLPASKLSLAISLATLLPSLSLYAQDTRTILTPGGQPIFEIRFFDVGDGPFQTDEDKPVLSTWNLDEQQKQKILQGVTYWANALTPAPGQLPVVINVGTYDEENATGAGGRAPSEDKVFITQVQAGLTNQTTDDLDNGSHGQFTMGKLQWDHVPYTPSQLPVTGNFDLAATTLHELGHALGVLNTVTDKLGEKSNTPYYMPGISIWAAHLRDDNGNPARPDQVVLCSLCNNPYDPTGFDLRQNRGYFSGEHVSEVLDGAMPGLPITILGGDGSVVDDDYMSHIELKTA